MNGSREPIALRALKFPYQLGVFIMRLYSSVVFLPFRALLKASQGFLFHEQFQRGDSQFYMKFGLLRGLVASLLGLTWLAAIISPVFVLTFLDHYIFPTPDASYSDSFVMTLMVTFTFSTLLAVLDIKGDRAGVGSLFVLKLSWYFVEDLISCALIALTCLMYFNADKIRKGNFEGPERRYLKYICFLFFLSILDWCIFIFKMLIALYPVRKYEHQILMTKYEENQFKQKMVTLQEGLFTLREILMLPFNLPIHCCATFVVHLPFISSMNNISHMGLALRVKNFWRSMLLITLGLVAVLLNGPLQNLSRRMFRELKAVRLADEPGDIYGNAIRSLFEPVRVRIRSALAKWVLFFCLCPNRARLIMALREPHKGKDPQTLPWLSWSFNNIYLELDDSITAEGILSEHSNDILKDFWALLCYLLTLPLNFVTFVQITRLVFFSGKPLTSESLDEKNEAILQLYPLIFFDIPLLLAMLLLSVLTLPFLPKNLPVYNTLLLRKQESFEYNRAEIKPKEMFFTNVFGVVVVLGDLFLTDLKTLLILPFFVWFAEHRRPIFGSWTEQYFNTKLRRELASGLFKFFKDFYYNIRKLLVREPKYKMYFSKIEPEVMKNLSISSDGTETDVYLRKIRNGFYAQKHAQLQRVFTSRWKHNLALANRKALGAIGLSRKFEKSDAILLQNNELFADPTINYSLLLDADDRYTAEVKSEIKGLCLKILFKLVSLTLLWRLPTFIQLMANGPFQNPDPEYVKDVKLALRLMRFCYKLMVADVLYQWLFSLLLLLSPSDRKYVEHKWQSLIVEGVMHTEEQVSQQFSAYFQAKKEYVVYVVDDLLTYVITGLYHVLIYRKAMFRKIKLLATIPQLENMNVRNINTLMLSILFKDWVVSCVALPMLLLSPLRLYSFILYVKEGFFSRDINTDIRYSKFESAVLISSSLDQKRVALFKKVFSGFKADLWIFSGVLLALLNPTKLYFLNILYKKLRIKFYLKLKKQGREFFDETLATDIIIETKLMWSMLYEDLMCVLAGFIILCGVYEVKTSWDRVGKLLRYYWRQSEVYRILNRPSKEAIVTHKEEGVFLQRIGWANIIELGDFLTMNDKLVLCQVNKRTRNFFMNTPFIWINYYRQNVNPSICEIDESMNIGIECINYYRTELAEKNDSELDFKLGIRFVLKEQAIKSVISLPQLVSSPYHLIFKLREFLTNRNVNINIGQLVTELHQDAGTEFTQYETNPDLQAQIRYRVKLRWQATPLTTESVPEDFKSRMRGFEVLEYFFYKVMFFMASLWLQVYGLFIRTVNYQPDGIIVFFVEVFKSVLQLAFVCLMLVVLYLVFMFYYSVIGMDFIHSLLGPLGIHILIGIMIANMQMHPYYARRVFNPFAIFFILKNITFTIGAAIGVPLWKYLRAFFEFFLTRFFDSIKIAVQTIKQGLRFVLSKVWFLYTLGLAVPTRLLVGRGVFLEVVHLLFVIAWVGWPGYYAYRLGGVRNISLGLLVCLAQTGVAKKVISDNSR